MAGVLTSVFINARIESEWPPPTGALPDTSIIDVSDVRIDKRRCGNFDRPIARCTTVAMQTCRLFSIEHLDPQCAPCAQGIEMARIHETTEETSRRLRNGKVAATVAVSWWIASIGGIIYVINNPPV